MKSGVERTCEHCKLMFTDVFIHKNTNQRRFCDDCRESRNRTSPKVTRPKLLSSIQWAVKTMPKNIVVKEKLPSMVWDQSNVMGY